MTHKHASFKYKDIPCICSMKKKHSVTIQVTKFGQNIIEI